MKKKRRKSKNKNIAFPLFLIFILIVLMSYASFLLYSFAKTNGLLSLNKNIHQNIDSNLKSNNLGNVDDNKKSDFTSNKKENSIKLDFLAKLFSQQNKNANKDLTNNNNENETKIDNNPDNSKDIDNSKNNETNNKVESQTNNSGSKDNLQNISNTNDKTLNKELNNISNNNIKSTKEKSNYKIISKYFIIFLAALDKQYELYLAKKTEKIDYIDSPIFAVISYLIKYKPKDPYLNLIPEGTKLLGAWIKNGILYLDFNSNFLNNKNGLKSIEIQIYQIVNTAMQFKEINGVRFLIEGKTRKYYSDEGFLLDITFKQKSFPPNE
ncbi:MAG TPA: GerMN domain-containing protein [Exilispira sp.]|nr:GerMN domain-containing protein [Exilispira sp.]